MEWGASLLPTLQPLPFCVVLALPLSPLSAWAELSGTQPRGTRSPLFHRCWEHQRNLSREEKTPESCLGESWAARWGECLCHYPCPGLHHPRDPAKQQRLVWPDLAPARNRLEPVRALLALRAASGAAHGATW